MPIIVKAGGDFIPAPEGSHIGVLVDVVDLGLVSITNNGKTESKRMVRLVWQIAETMLGRRSRRARRYLCRLS